MAYGLVAIGIDLAAPLIALVILRRVVLLQCARACLVVDHPRNRGFRPAVIAGRYFLAERLRIRAAPDRLKFRRLAIRGGLNALCNG
ncbi:MAG: hypothetical protein WBL23_03375 [Salinisphaera sp.]|uniref:hypothetical protein n=1 Tax=Salinisphaera sp. TaxID=1914330 RepID=UPI003C7D59B1